MEENKNVSGIAVVILTLLLFAYIACWAKECHLHVNMPMQSIIEKISTRSMVIRFIFLVTYAGFILLMPAKVRIKDDHTKLILVITTFFIGSVLVVGCIGIYYYDIVVYPVLFILYLILAIYAISAFRSSLFKTEEIFGISHEKSDFYFTFGSDKGDLTIHKPQQNVWIDGGPGAGKSDTFIKSIIEQSCQRNYAMCLYDWEGDPDKKDSPLLSRVAYGCIQKYKDSGCRLNFAFINFIDMTRTVRVNVFSERYIPKGNEALFIRNIIVTLLKNLEPAWKEKTDFWANNAITYVYSVAYKCFKERDKGINTLPHVISICLEDSEAVFKWLSEDSEISLNMSSILTAWKLGAQQQTAGAVSSAQTPLSIMNNKNIFWVLSPKAEDEFNLDITDKKNPAILCIGNSPSNKESVSPPISCIISVVLSNMNNPGKEKSVLLVDEFPTVVLQGLDNFSATARKHFVATILALQDYAQAERNIGKDSAKILRSNCGTQMFGQTGNYETARMVQDFLGDIDQVSESYTTQDTGSGSQSESMKKEKVMNARDVAGQPTGHFVGKVANGKPPFFSAQFDLEVAVQKDIPQFSLLVDTKDPKKNRELMDAIVQKNYERVLQDVENLLAPYLRIISK